MYISYGSGALLHNPSKVPGHALLRSSSMFYERAVKGRRGRIMRLKTATRKTKTSHSRTLYAAKGRDRGAGERLEFVGGAF